METSLVPIDRKRKLDHDDSSLATIRDALDSVYSKPEEGLDVLQLIIENDILKAKLSTNDSATSLLIRWFRIIASDQERLRVFRQWVNPSSPDVVRQDLTCISKTVSIVSSPSIVLPPINHSPTSLSSSSASISSILADVLAQRSINRSSGDAATHDNEGYFQRSGSNCSTGTFIPDTQLCKLPTAPGHQQILNQVLNQQQGAPLQSLQRSSPTKQVSSTTLNLSPKQGSANTLLTVNIQGGNWHACSPRCECTLSFTAGDGSVATAQRIPGGAEGVLLFMVPHIIFDSATPPSVQVFVRLSLCTAPQAPLVCLEPFTYTPRERSCTSSTGSDDDSEGSLNDCEEEDGGSPPQALPPLDVPSTSTPTPKQMMTIRERMLEQIQRGNRGPARLTVLQQPSVRVVWKNRRLDVPFKLRVECVEDSANPSAFNSLAPSKLVLVGVVADHKGRLQIDAAENFIEDFSSQALAHFSNLRMTKGTWGKEWTITFAAVVKTSMNNPVVVGVSPSCPIVVKTRKNPQVRHNANRAESSPSSSPPVQSIERKNSDPSLTPRIKRHRVEDLLDNTTSTSSMSAPSHTEDMASLLAAAEMKQQEQMQGEHEEPSDAPCLPMMIPSANNNNNNSSSSSSNNDGEQSFANFQSLMTFLDDIRLKRQISIAIIDQPVPKRDSKALIVKKGKPFRVPFSLQLKSSLTRYNPQDYVCVAVVKNDKGEEVAVRNSEVPFDWRGVACFAGLMVMKGTWGKTVRLTFEARWAAAGKKGVGASVDKAAWSAAQKMMAVSETSSIPLMCYTKDKKGSPTPSG